MWELQAVVPTEVWSQVYIFTKYISTPVGILIIGLQLYKYITVFSKINEHLTLITKKYNCLLHSLAESDLQDLHSVVSKGRDLARQ